MGPHHDHRELDRDEDDCRDYARPRRDDMQLIREPRPFFYGYLHGLSLL